ncbi:MAG: molecular chaperone [Microbacterium sp.]|nr:MAG: molecular chaperone [Microbacterium sp.]
MSTAVSDSVSTLPALGAFPSIDLAELTADAELLTRVDRKYVLPRSELASVLSALPRGTRVLEIDGERAQRYASQYFDTPALDSYYGAALGRRRRFKVRARTYVDSGGSYLEVKTRGGRSATVKTRVPVSGCALDDDAVAYASDLLTDAGVPGADDLAAALVPVLETRYRRTTLLLPATAAAEASRGTIDTELTWIARDGRALALPASVIVETKSGQRAGALDRALWRRGHRPASVSKYGTGMAALHPALPSHKWRRVLTRDFAASPADVSRNRVPHRKDTP